MNRRAIAIVAVSLGGLAIVFGLLASLSSVQTWAARRVVAAKVPTPVAFDRVSISWNKIEVDGLRTTFGSVALVVPQATAQVSVWRLATGSVRIRNLVAQGWTARWSPTEAAPEQVSELIDPVGTRQMSAGWGEWLAQLDLAATESKLAVPNLESWLQLPVKLEITAVDLNGYAEWRNAGPGEDGHAHVSITGGNLRAGQRSQIRVKIEAESEAVVGASIQTLNIETNLGVKLATPDRIGGLWISSSLRGKRATNPQWDVYQFDFGFDGSGATPRLRFSLADESRALFSSDIFAGSSEVGLSGEWSVALTDDNVTSLMLGTRMPRFSITGNGKIHSNYELSELDLEGNVQFEAERLEVFDPKAGAVGQVTGQLDFAGKRMAQDVRFTRWDLSLNGAQPVMRARLLQGVEFSFTGLEVRVEQPTDPVAVIDIIGLPLNWLQPWLSPWIIDGRPIRGQIIALATDRGVRFVTSDPVLGTGIVAAIEGQSIIEGVDLSLNFGSEITTDGWQVEIDRMELGDDSGTWVELSARGGQLMAEDGVFKVAGRIQADLATPNKLPILQGRWGLASGRLDGEFGVGVSERISLAVAMELKDLTTHDAQSLPSVQLDGRVDRLPDGAVEVHLPLQFARGERVSDITLNSRMAPDSGGWRVEGSLSGPRAYLDDIQLLGLGLALKPNAEPVPPATASATAGAPIPIWHGLSGRFETAIGFLELPNGLSLSNLRGEIQLAEAGISLENFTAVVGQEGSVSVTGQVDFDASRPQLYSAVAQVKADAVEAGPLLKTLEVESPLPFEGKVNLVADWSGAAAAVDGLWAEGELEATLTSSGGVLRVLGVNVDQYVKTGKTVAALGGLLALATGDTRTQNYATRLQSLTAVAEQLAALTFDQLNLVVKRGSTGDVEVSEISLISPYVRLLGNGRINFQPGVPLWSQPLLAQLRLSARDQLAADLKTLNLLNSQADALGYMPLTNDIVLDGSLASIGTAQLQNMLSRALTSP